MKFLAILLCAATCFAHECDGLYKGPWATTNPYKKLHGVMQCEVKKLHGVMQCEVKKLEADKWQGHFWGRWEGIDFDYTVEFTGQPNSLTGVAKVDGADYDWVGYINPQIFQVNFEGSRYEGYFELERQ